MEGETYVVVVSYKSIMVQKATNEKKRATLVGPVLKRLRNAVVEQ
jgi:hypothetical protein